MQRRPDKPMIITEPFTPMEILTGKHLSDPTIKVDPPEILIGRPTFEPIIAAKHVVIPETEILIGRPTFDPTIPGLLDKFFNWINSILK